MRSVDDHRHAILQMLAPLEPVDVALADADGAALADEVRAAAPLPLFDNSAMDGYAVRTADLTTVPITLPVLADIAAGHADPAPLAPGTVVRIMTGAPLPPGGDAVVPVEWTDAGHTRVRIEQVPPAGAHIRRAGEDVASGAVVLASGATLTPSRLALLSALGHATVKVHRRPRVAVVPTGSELTAAGRSLPAGRIYDANTALLTAAIRRFGGDVVSVEPVPDRSDVASRVLSGLTGQVDLVVTAGGISAGAYEVVKETLAGEIEFVRVAMSPGMPQGCGRWHGCPVIALPGNPVSAFVAAELFVRPAVRRLGGHGTVDRRWVPAALAEPVERLPHKQRFAPATWTPGAAVRVTTGAGHRLSAFTAADALVRIPPGDGELPAGTCVDVLPLDG